MTEDDARDFERLAAKLVAAASQAKDSFRLGQNGYSESHYLYQDAVKVKAHISAMIAQGCFR